jgi:peptide-methionine (S)-S-oxide reductase
MFFQRKKAEMPVASDALPGRSTAIPTSINHYVNGNALKGPFPKGVETILLGMGCFWGAERKFWQLGENVHVTAVGYAGGFTNNPTYEEVCSGRTGHNEVVLVAFDPTQISLARILKTFWESHDPTQGMRQGNDIGTQYRSGIYCVNPAHLQEAKASAEMFQAALIKAGLNLITTEIIPAPEFFYAEDYHQQYLAKNPGGYCGLGGTGVSCPVGAFSSEVESGSREENATK